MKNLRLTLFVLLLLSVVKPGYCWDGVGHMLIAQIAYDRLTPAAKTQVDKLSAALNDDPLTEQLAADLKPYQPVTVATWPDDIRGLGDETRQYSPWHFIDLDALPPVTITIGPDGLPEMPLPDAAAVAAVEDYTNPNSDVYLQIINQSAILKDQSAPIADRARALAFVEHFVGDIHQPLHCIGRQRGGNQYKIDPLPGADPTWPITNLHAFWDNAYRYQVVNNTISVNALLQIPRPQAADTGEIKTWADMLVKKYLPSAPALAGQSDPAVWAAESSEIAVSFAFPSDNATTLSSAYIQEASDIARERIALAGVRLANFLNTMFATN